MLATALLTLAMGMTNSVQAQSTDLLLTTIIKSDATLNSIIDQKAVSHGAKCAVVDGEVTLISGDHGESAFKLWVPCNNDLPNGLRWFSYFSVEGTVTNPGLKVSVQSANYLAGDGATPPQ